MCDLKIHRGFMCQDNEQWCKIWREIDLPFQNWHDEFEENSPEHSKVSKICTLMGSFWTNYFMFQLKMYIGVMFHDNEEWCKFFFFFSIWIFIHDHSRTTGLQGKGESISWNPHYHFHTLHKHLDISLVITAESSPLHIGSSRTRTGNLWFPSASC